MADEFDIFRWDGQEREAVEDLILTVMSEYFPEKSPGVAENELGDYIDQPIKNRFFMLKRGGLLIGTFGLKNIDFGTVLLEKFYIGKSFRSRGIGTRVLPLIISEARQMGAKVIHLETASVFREAIQFYEKNGFTLVEDKMRTSSCDRYYVRKITDNGKV